MWLRASRSNWNVGLESPPHTHGKIAGWKHRDGHAVRHVLLAYDLIHDSGALSAEQCAMIDRGRRVVSGQRQAVRGAGKGVTMNSRHPGAAGGSDQCEL